MERSIAPWLQDADVTLYHGDVLSVLPSLPAESVDCVVTSPPYWGLRDYGTGAWEGGDAECEHRRPRSRRDGAGRERPDLPNPPASWAERDSRVTSAFTECECGATRIDQQLGLEPTPEQYVERMVEVFREVRRVLAPHGTVWLNLGDSYNSSSQHNHGKSTGLGAANRYTEADEEWGGHRALVPNLKPKDLVGIPWRVAFALQADGWYLRSDIIWAKPNPMPESVTDRPTKAHEYVFLLSKQPRYFFDQEAVREAWQGNDDRRWRESLRTGDAYINQVGPQNNGAKGPDGRRKTSVQGADGSIQHRDGERWPNGGRNIRSVWEIATQPYPEAHFATFPEELARRCIAAGCPEQVCRVCGKARERITSVEYDWYREPKERNFAATSGYMGKQGHARKQTTTEGFTDCGHFDYRSGIVLDPFIGSGTVAHVARKLGRHAIGIDLSAEYLALAARRLQQQSLFAGAESGL